MTAFAMALPLLPGKAEEWKKWVQEISEEYVRDFQASRANLGITREASFLQQSPQGEMAILLIEAEDVGRALFGIATSQSPFDEMFRQKTLEFFGLDLTQPPAGPPPVTVLDWHSTNMEV